MHECNLKIYLGISYFSVPLFAISFWCEPSSDCNKCTVYIHDFILYPTQFVEDKNKWRKKCKQNERREREKNGCKTNCESWIQDNKLQYYRFKSGLKGSSTDTGAHTLTNTMERNRATFLHKTFKRTQSHIHFLPQLLALLISIVHASSFIQFS